MTNNGVLKIDDRQAHEIVQALLARRLGYVPGWTPVEGGFGWASVQIYARFLQALIERLNQAPDKNKLAFFDMLGIDLLPAQAARAPVVFQMQPNAGNSRAPAGTRLGAKVPGMSDPLIFETENAIGLAAARLAEVRTVWPEKDKYADHSVSVIGGQPFALFDEQAMQPVPHELYLAHDTLFALAGDATVKLRFFIFSKLDNQPLAISWDYYGIGQDGVSQDWQPLTVTADDTVGLDNTTELTNIRIIHLEANSAKAQPTMVNGQQAYWIRGHLKDLLELAPGKLPQVHNIQVRTEIERVWWSVIQSSGDDDEPPLNGKVVDSQGNPVLYAPIKVAHRDSNWEAVTLCDREGEFNFINGFDPAEEYTVSAIQTSRSLFKTTIIDVAEQKIGRNFNYDSTLPREDQWWDEEINAVGGAGLCGSVNIRSGEHVSGLAVEVIGKAFKAIGLCDEHGEFNIEVDPNKKYIANVVRIIDSPIKTRVTGLDEKTSIEFKLAHGLDPDQAFADGQKLDLSKAFYPFGPLAGQGSAFYFACEELASKPGAQVTVRVQKVETEQERADREVEPYEKEVREAEDSVEKSLSNARAIKSTLDSMRGKDGILEDGSGLPSLFDQNCAPKEWHSDLKDHICTEMLEPLSDLAKNTRDRYWHACKGYPDHIWTGNYTVLGSDLETMETMRVRFHIDSEDEELAEMLKKLKEAIGYLRTDSGDPDGQSLLWTALNGLEAAYPKKKVYPAGDKLPKFFVSPDDEDSPREWWSGLLQDIDSARLDLKTDVIDRLEEITSIGGTALYGAMPPQLPEVRLVWEYWDGENWKPLLKPQETVAAVNSEDVPAANLVDSGWFSFTVPRDMAFILVNGVKARWMRARIASGSFHKLTIVSWQDKSGNTNVISVIEPRPPVLDAFYLGYSHTVDTENLAHYLTYNDFEFQNHTQDACAVEIVFLFYVSLELERFLSELDQGILSESLLHEFKEHGILLSKDCLIAPFVGPDKKWLICDQDSTYLAFQGNALEVYKLRTFTPFSPVSDDSPTLYLGLDHPLPTDMISLYLDIQEQGAPDLARDSVDWEYWDGTAWSALSIYHDDTRNLTQSGMVAFSWPGVNTPPAADVIQANGDQVQLLDACDAARFRPGDQVYVAEKDTGELVTVVESVGDRLTLKTPLSQPYGRATIRQVALHAALPDDQESSPPLELARFGTPYTWIRARLQEDDQPLHSRINAIHLNAVWAAQTQTTEDELLGSSTGQMNQVFFFQRAPVLPDEQIEVRELSGDRADVEWALLAREILGEGDGVVQVLEDRLKAEKTQADVIEGDLRLRRDRNGRVNEVWVRWQAQPHLLFSGPDERHYVVERTTGRVIFGDGRRGKLPPTGANNVVARTYRAGGGLDGNVAAGAIEQLLAAVPYAQSVTNPCPAEGGVDEEQVKAVLTRGPRTVRHRHQAITLSDYEALAREASPAVAVARALHTADSNDQSTPGWVRVIAVPQSQEVRPQPSLELCQRVRDFLMARAPTCLTDRIQVEGPTYLPIGLEAVVAPVDPTTAGAVHDAVKKKLADFLHPLTGGPEGTGWPFGRDVYLSDVAAVLESVAGVDYVEAIRFLSDDGTPLELAGVAVPDDRIIAAGLLRVTLTGSER